MLTTDVLWQKTYGIYAEDAVFHDPVGIAQGLKSIRAQFNGLAQVCAMYRQHSAML